MEGSIILFKSFASKIVPRLTSGAEIKKLQAANSELLKSQLKDLSKFAAEVPKMQAGNEALMKSLEKLAQAAKAHI